MFPASPKNKLSPGAGTNLSGVELLPIFSTRAASKEPLTVGTNITGDSSLTGLTGNMSVSRSDSLFVASSLSVSSSNVATSPDGGDNWILRSMPSSAAWICGAAADNLVAIELAGAATAKSTDGGLTWSSGGALSAAADADIDNAPAHVGGVWTVFAATGTTTNYTSTNQGASWSVEALPLTNIMAHFLTVGDFFWFYNTGTTSYTSETATTGSWVVRTLPITPSAASIWKNPGEDAIYISSGTAGDPIYKTTDGVTWVDSGLKLLTSSQPSHRINNVPVYFDAPTADSIVVHGGVRNNYWSEGGVMVSSRISTDGEGTFIVPHGSGVVSRISPDYPRGLFV